MTIISRTFWKWNHRTGSLCDRLFSLRTRPAAPCCQQPGRRTCCEGLWQVPSEATASGGRVCWGRTPKQPACASGVTSREVGSMGSHGRQLCAWRCPGHGAGLPSSLSLAHSKADASGCFAVAAPTCAGAGARVAQSLFPTPASHPADSLQQPDLLIKSNLPVFLYGSWSRWHAFLVLS